MTFTYQKFGHDGMLDDMILLFFPAFAQMYISIA